MSLAEPDAAPAALPPPAAPAALVRAAPTADPLPPLRLLPAPPSAPPFDDELPAVRPLRVVARPVRDRAGAAAPDGPAGAGLRLVPTGDELAGLLGDPEPGRRRTPLAHLPAPRPFAHALVQRLLEVLAGLRPLSQLQRDTTFELFEQLERTVVSRPRTAGPRPSRRDVRSVHVQQRADGVAEVCATVHRDGRATAIALRLEGVDGAWRCTAMDGV